MSEEFLTELANRAGLGTVAVLYPALVRASIERGTAQHPVLDETRIATTEPAHVFTPLQNT